MTRKNWIVLTAAVLALLLGGRMVLRYLDWQASEAQRASDARVDVAALQSLASAACQCARAEGEAGEDACWHDYKAAIPSAPTGGYGTSCAPVSTETECFATASGEVCIVKGYYANGASDPALDKTLCTAEEAKAVEYAYEEGWLGPDGEAPNPDDSADWDASNQRANAAVNRVMRQIMNGEEIAAAGPVSESCTG